VLGDWKSSAFTTSAIPGQHVSALISTGYIFGFRKDNAIFFNRLSAFRESLLPRLTLWVYLSSVFTGTPSPTSTVLHECAIFQLPLGLVLIDLMPQSRADASDAAMLPTYKALFYSELLSIPVFCSDHDRTPSIVGKR
jgi:hypothetical protein